MMGSRLLLGADVEIDIKVAVGLDADVDVGGRLGRGGGRGLREGRAAQQERNRKSGSFHRIYSVGYISRRRTCGAVVPRPMPRAVRGQPPRSGLSPRGVIRGGKGSAGRGAATAKL
jgi:hypothetical protein